MAEGLLKRTQLLLVRLRRWPGGHAQREPLKRKLLIGHDIGDLFPRNQMLEARLREAGNGRNGIWGCDQDVGFVSPISEIDRRSVVLKVSELSLWIFEPVYEEE